MKKMATSFINRPGVVRNLLSASRPMKQQCAVRGAQYLDLNTAASTPPTLVEDVIYPPIKPKYPPGEWGKMDRKYAWMWETLKNRLLELPTASERMNVFLEKERDRVILDQVNDHPSCLEFRKYVTKSVLKLLTLKDGETTTAFYQADSSQLENVVDELKKSLSDHFLMEHESVNRDGKNFLNQRNGCQRLIQTISDTFVSKLGTHFKHYHEVQLHEDVISRALWECCGLANDSRDGDVEYSTIDDIMTILEEINEGVQSEILLNLVLRCHSPLPEVVPQFGDLSQSSKSPDLEFRLSSYGHSHTKKRKMESILAGHKTGDPCEFGILGFIDTCDTNSIEETMNLQVAKDCRKAMGITGAFTWLASQAYNQGFNPAIDLTYPLTSQVILTDGHRFSFFLYQLNTLSLWNPANRINNICWHSEELPLYHNIENGHVKELNEDVIQLLAQMFLAAPVDRGYDMKPTLADKETDSHLKADFIPEKVIVEEVIEEEKYIV